LLDAQEYGVPQHRERVIFCGVRVDLKWFPAWPRKAKFLVTLREAFEGVDGLPNQDHISGEKVTPDGTMQGQKPTDWDKPSPAATTSRAHPHPDGERRMSVREVARVQTLPDDMTIYGTMGDKYKMIGNAVPCVLAVQLAQMLADFCVHAI
jgi:DNA (cytosine-5)-methyltransferase 1